MHEGRPAIREAGDMIIMVCPYGHVVTGIIKKDWGGSWLEAQAGNPDWKVKCDGALPRGRPGEGEEGE